MLIFSMLGLLVFFVFFAMLDPQGIDTARVAAEHLLAQSRASTTEIGWTTVPILVLAGFIAGFLTGMLGMGGGVFKVLFILFIFKMDIFFARAVSLLTMFFSSTSALYFYARRRLVLWAYVGPMLLLAIPAALLAAMLGNSLRGSTLTHLFGVFVFFLAFNTLALIAGDPDEHRLLDEFRDQSSRQLGYLSALIGGMHGAVSGLLGVSGGVIALPLQQSLLKMPARFAIANALVVSVFVTALASIVVISAGVGKGAFDLYTLFFVDLFMGAGVALGAPLGARLGGRCNITLLRILFAALTFGAGIMILF